MLEDDYSDVLRKAMLGRGLGEEVLAERAGIGVGDWQRFVGGGFSEVLARACAPVLGLKPEALAAHPGYHPRPLELAGLRRLVLPFGAYEVNAWWVDDGVTGILFDLGHEPGDLIRALPGRPDVVFVTHAHRDHVGALQWALGEGIEVVLPEVPAGMHRACGAMEVRSVDLSGHCEPQLGYFIEGLGRPVLVTGDALFAGSIGRCATPALFDQAIGRLHRVLDPMPDDLILLPGHGPATTLGEERRSNPFL